MHTVDYAGGSRAKASASYQVVSMQPARGLEGSWELRALVFLVHQAERPAKVSANLAQISLCRITNDYAWKTWHKGLKK
jgi:hypothetical protein